MRSFTVPVSFSNLLFPTIPPDFSVSFLLLSPLAPDDGGSEVGEAGCCCSGCCCSGFCCSGCCAVKGDTPTENPANRSTARIATRSLPCLFMTLLLSPKGRFFSLPRNRTSFQKHWAPNEIPPASHWFPSNQLWRSEKLPFWKSMEMRRLRIQKKRRHASPDAALSSFSCPS